MKNMSETSMNMIEPATNTTIISSECGHGLKNDENQPKTKKCYKCGRVLSVDAFGKKTSSKDGLQDMCKECKNAYMRERNKRISDAAKGKEDKVEKEIVLKNEQERPMLKVYTDAVLAKFTPRQLMQELKARGFKWEWMLEPQRKIYFDKI